MSLHALIFSSLVEAAGAFSLSFNGVHDKLFKLAVNDITLTLDAARAKMKIGPDVSPDIGACFNFMLPAPFLALLLKAINSPSCNDVPVNAGQLEDFFNILLLLSRYRCSPSDFFSELKHGAESQFGPHENLAGSEKMFSRCMQGLSFASNAEHRGNEWAESQMFDHNIADAAKGILSYVPFIVYLFNTYLQRNSNHYCFNVLRYYIFFFNYFFYSIVATMHGYIFPRQCYHSLYGR